jgi:hypothetical protein
MERQLLGLYIVKVAVADTKLVQCHVERSTRAVSWRTSYR